jgi:hypothetical protein
MPKKRAIIILLIILASSIIAFTGYKIVNGISEKKASEEADRKRDTEHHYSQQNAAFFGWAISQEHLPYKKDYEWRLQAYMNLYIRKTGKFITLGDVETFLATPENPDGTPRTWKNDETGIIKDYVDWYWLWLSSDEMRFYERNIDLVLVEYNRQNPNCPYRILRDLPPEQFIELDKKHIDPDYDLVLTW